MTTRLATVTSPDDQRPPVPVYRMIIAVDLEGSTTRTDPVKGELRRVMYDLLRHCMGVVGITGDRLDYLHDRGDGVLVLVRAHDAVPKTVLLDWLVPLLAAMLAQYNAQVAHPALRMRLRAVVHAGEVYSDSRGCYGETVDVAVRLLEAPPVKRTLKQAVAPLVVVISDEIYFAIVKHGYVDAGAYLPLVHVSVLNRRHRGWVHIPFLRDTGRPGRVPGNAPRAAGSVQGSLTPVSRPAAARTGEP